MTRMAAIATLAGVLTAGVLAAGLLNGQQGPQVAFPEGYRDWAHVKSAVILPGHVNYEAFGGVHHVYANDLAVGALKDGTPLPKGAVLVFDLLEETVEDNAITEGPRKVIGVMEKDPDRFADTEGWGFEDFRLGDPSQPSVRDMREQCLSCHESRRASDFVYSVYRR
ncbi:MAG: cytochrome P460 family protein [Gemmatimonadota bacterium]|nr:cytochrome P460 family protein [Gemmatimonadota bacterium]